MKSQIWSLIAIVALSGCDAETGSQSPAASPRVFQTGKGIIRGEVRFTGTIPVMPKIANVPCHDGAEKELVEETVVVNSNGTLRNVFVYLEGAGRSDGADRSPAVLDQASCRYVPHVIGVQLGQKLSVRSSDPTMHNVHGLSQRNPAFNFGLTAAGQEKKLSFAAAEFIPVKCDVHPWMSACIGVFENPCFAVTGDDGSFELTGLPAGDYMLVAWHEHYGRLEQDVTIGEDKPLAAAFEYKPPTNK